jgi:hypothetical protein
VSPRRQGVGTDALGHVFRTLVLGRQNQVDAVRRRLVGEILRALDEAASVSTSMAA